MYIGLVILTLIYIFMTVCFRQNMVPTPKPHQSSLPGRFSTRRDLHGHTAATPSAAACHSVQTRHFKGDLQMAANAPRLAPPSSPPHSVSWYD